ncbi:MAG TPA: hypothetical protein VGA50_14425 [Kiloniellales bacterium]
MRVWRLLGLILALIVNLGPLAAQAMDRSMVMPGQSMPSNSISALDSPSCECCPDCDGLAVLGACSLLCVNHPGSMTASAAILVSEIGHSVPPWANNWTDRTFPPDLHPPRALPSI